VTSDPLLPRLKDKVQPPVKALLVGINPGIRSSLTGHHFAGYSNRFWKLLYEARLVPEPIRAEDDARLPEWGFGVTNIVPRPTPGIDTLTPEEYAAGARVLARKVRRWKPAVVVFVGVTAYRAALQQRTVPVTVGLQRDRFAGARVFVLPNPSGRNANYSYAEMLAAFKALRSFLVRSSHADPAENQRGQHGPNRD
jgi:double-stranded uracil-DNA glycosylase